MAKQILERHRFAPELNVIHRRLPKTVWADPLTPEFARIPAPGCTSLAAYRAKHRPAQQTAVHVTLKVKYLDPQQLRSRLARLVEGWPLTRQRLVEQLVPAREFQHMLRLSGAPSRPEDIGLTSQDVRATFPKAMYYRSRYTVLDVAREAGWFEELVEETFAPGVLWD